MNQKARKLSKEIESRETLRQNLYCEHNEMLQAHPKYICRNKDVYGRNKVDAKYWYDQPIVGNHKQSLERIDIPDWCPILEV